MKQLTHKPLMWDETTASFKSPECDGEKLVADYKNKLLRLPIPLGSTPAECAHIDYLGFTMRILENSKQSLDQLKTDLDKLFAVKPSDWQKTHTGWYGYKRRINLVNAGLIAYGGTSQKGTIHIEITGQGCARVPDWQAVAQWIEDHNYKITRTDLAYDDLEGETVDMDKCLEWHREGLFNASGRPPRSRHIDDMGSGAGQTLYVGHRSNGKMARMYEKGKEQGDPESRWFRIEVELRSKSRLLPSDILTSPGQYLAGTYKAFNFISIIQNKIKTIQRGGIITYDKQVKWLKTAGGKTINAMLQVEGGDIGRVIEKLRREGLPSRLEPFADNISEISSVI
jgi:phage replication initiation protein